jgi:hypothetical protein
MNYPDVGLLALILLVWLALSRWVLPWFGVPTCMSCGCSMDRDRPLHGPPQAKPTGDES